MIVLIFCILQSACSNPGPSKKKVVKDLKTSMQYKPLKDSMALKELFILEGVTITNQILASKKECTISFIAKLKVIETVYYCVQYRGAYRKKPSWANDKRALWYKIRGGRRLETEGKAYYNLLETGWKLHQYDAPIKDKDDHKIAQFRVPKLILKTGISNK